MNVSEATSVQPLDHSTLYTSNANDLLKSCINSLVQNACKYKNGTTGLTHIQIKCDHGSNCWKEQVHHTKHLQYDRVLGGQYLYQVCGLTLLSGYWNLLENYSLTKPKK